MQPESITLEEWAAQKWSRPPSLYTLRLWARSGMISPAPEKVGKVWHVRRDAEYSRDQVSDRVRGILG